MSECEDPEVHLGRMRNPLESDRDVINIVMLFTCDDTFLFVAGVSTQWRDAWGQRRTVTSPRWAVQSRSCLDWATACGLDMWDGPCLHAAAEGNLDVLQYAIAQGYSREGMPICEYAAGGGHLEVAKWCRASGYPLGRSILRAAKGGHLEVIQWCRDEGYPWDEGESNAPQGRRSRWRPPSRLSGTRASAVIDMAARAGQLDVVRWCREQGSPWSPTLTHVAASGGHLELLKWLRANACPWSPHTMHGAAAADDPEILEWCRVNGCPFSSGSHAIASHRGNLEVMRWFLATFPNGPGSNICCNGAAAQGNLEVVKLLRAERKQWGARCCYHAASGGHFEVLKWCVANGCPWQDTLLRPGDGFKGSVPMMLWAIANGCTWMSAERDFDNICQHAAAAGNLEVLQWCHTLYAMHGPAVSRAAASKGHVHVLEWLQASGILSDKCALAWLRMHRFLSGGLTDIRLCGVAAVSGSLEVVKWCRSNGYPWDWRTCEGAARVGNLKLLQWCRTNGCPWDETTCRAAAARGDLEMLVWCRANSCPWDKSTLRVAVNMGYDEVVEWCKAHDCPTTYLKVPAVRERCPMMRRTLRGCS